ncbi:MAG: peptide ABC transporter substrate-binding protein [Candidatus Pristimantibacillus lignocellulolyticus]|uniref:Peptide ABC transporter substrate-binding protein n=1 Tax=Candidatus Pristimantibacillus lignocellulolyticus TaxID=2994561 RepID=A0A9J6ZIJ9_9BACL|nr:MAG: peptide ABC transporter substrate-binding protein [Candidatus Pristimantibacillus lignocellulolyticus]
MNRKNLISILSLVLVLAIITTGCASGSKNESGASNNEFRMNLATEPPTLDPAQATDQVSFTVINAIYEGLTIVDENGDVQPGVAEKWDISPDGKTYTFTIRQDAKWKNGDAVTANDFEFSWKRALNPELVPEPSQYAYQMYYIEGAEAYNTGKGSADDVAVKATDEHTLVVTLTNPIPYFESLLSTAIYFPVHSSVTENEAFAAAADTMITNGPFTMTEWKRNTSIVLEPNENYHARNDIKFAKVSMTIVNDPSSELNMYKTGKLDYAGHPTGSLPTEQYATLKKEYPDDFNIKGTASLYYYIMNTTAEPFNNAKIRQALSMAISRTDLTEKVSLGGQIPAFGLVPPGIKGVEGEFRSEFKDDYFQENVEEAKALLAEGLAEEGWTELPAFTLKFNTDATHQKVAEAVVDMWRSNLGIDAQIGNEEWGVYLDNRVAMNFQIERSGWGADYNDPISFVGLFTSASGNNNTGYANPEYDALIAEINATTDTKARMELIAKAEKMLIDSHSIMPIYYYSSVHMMRPDVKGVYVDFKGDVNYTRGYYEQEQE